MQRGASRGATRDTVTQQAGHNAPAALIRCPYISDTTATATPSLRMESGDGPNAITGPSGHAPPHPHHGLPSGGFSVAPHPPPFYGDSMKLTRGHSCVLCQQRKVRCDKQKPCANCVKAGAECKVIPPQPPRRRRKKPLERDLIGQLKKYETLLAQNGIKFDPIADDLKPGDIHSEDVNDLGQNLGGLKTSPESSTAADYEGGGGDKSVAFPCGRRGSSRSNSEIQEYEVYAIL